MIKMLKPAAKEVCKPIKELDGRLMKTICSVLLLCSLGIAQEFPRPKFWTRDRITTTSMLSAEAAYDGWTTQGILSRHGKELDPLTRPMVVHGTSGQIASSAVSIGGVLGLQYLAHRMHHEKIANAIGHLSVTAEAVNCTRNQFVLNRMK